MSQITSFGTGSGPVGDGILTITGDTGGAIGPDGGGNLNMVGAHGINTAGAGNTITVAINNTIALGDLAVVAANDPSLTLTTGDLDITAGNINIPNTVATGTMGVVYAGGNRFISNLGGAGSNTFVGQLSGNLVGAANAGGNSGFGSGSLFNVTTGGTNNTAVGVQALFALTSSGGNVAVGVGALSALTTGTGQNVVVGHAAASSLATGANNVIIGEGSGGAYNTSESSNILISSDGSVGESNTTRIGNQGAGVQQQNRCFIAGIVGVTTSNSQSVTIDSTTGQLGVVSGIPGFTWSVETGASVAMVVNHGYIANNAGTMTLSLPASAAVGSIIEITGMNNATGWQVTQAAGQQIFFGVTQTTLGATGTITSSATRDAIRMVCIVANTTWQVLSVVGNPTVA